MSQKRSEFPKRGALTNAATIVHLEPDFVMALFKNIFFVAWGTQATLPRVRTLESVTDGILARVPGSISAIHLIVHGVALPAAGTRAELDRLTDKYAQSLVCMGTVIEGSGFWASAMQSFVTSLHWLSRRPFKVRIASTLSDVAGWLSAPHAEATGVKVTGAELVEIFSPVRDRLR